MTEPDRRQGLAELRAARAQSNGLFAAVFAFSVVVNLLMLTGPLYMLQIYDRVLGSQSEETLVALTVLVAFLFLCMGLLDHVRGRLMARVGAWFQGQLDARVFRAAVRRLALFPSDPLAAPAQRDLEAVQRFLASPVLMALFDLPWTALFIAAIFVFHPLLGWLAVGGGALLILVTLLNQWLTRAPLERTNRAAIGAERFAESLKAESEVMQALGMAGAGFARWQQARGLALNRTIASTDLIGLFSVISKTFRLFLQSAMLGLGAWLVLRGELTAGAMIAGSILLGRALQPVEVAVAQWALVQRAQEGWWRLAALLTAEPAPLPVIALPRPRALLDVQGLTVAPPGENRAVLRGVAFRLEPGQALGVIGPSGSGKSTLARALIGAWPAAGGTVRLDGATLAQYDPDVLGSYIGYLPQRVSLFDGTIADNIARLTPAPDGAQVVAAARRAAAHEMVLRLPDGYDTQLSALGGRLSGGQTQRIGLARALYGEPLLLVLDEPNSNLDNEGSTALNLAIRAVKAAGGAVLIMAHRPSAILECDLLLVLDAGIARAFGPRDRVLSEMVQNHAEITANPGPGGVR
ncbi:MAG: type I secretion system permease/ATPase [Rhodobacteraceae bacterium]|nr:type I secretion system permease/ATPase [Paracoccaceae bacterium]